MSDAAAREILITGARALAHAEGREASLRLLIGSMAEQLGVDSAAVFVLDRRSDGLEIAATHGLEQPAIAGLAAAVGDPQHPIARTVAAPVPTFDVLPTAPGGPALRSHLPLFVTRDGAAVVLGVLALAHERPMDAAARPLLLAGADLAAAAIDARRAS